MLEKQQGRPEDLFQWPPVVGVRNPSGPQLRGLAHENCTEGASLMRKRERVVFNERVVKWLMMTPQTSMSLTVSEIWFLLRHCLHESS